MTLKDYNDIIQYELKDYDLPWEYVHHQVNTARREIAKLTRCLQCRSTLTSRIGDNQYRVPRSERDNDYIDIVMVLGVKYDGLVLEWLNNDEISYRSESSSQGTPTHWAYFGGEAQPTGYIQLEPTPDAEKEIEVRAIQYPQPLIYPSDECELNDVVQKIVSDLVVGEIMTKRGRPEGATLLRLVHMRIYQNMWLLSK